jgi:hypothetical protein|tara:strand:+ start:768 stop:1019 length:252 start_codon:yes stop_codon:yes gene_type:complete
MTMSKELKRVKTYLGIVEVKKIYSINFDSTNDMQAIQDLRKQIKDNPSFKETDLERSGEKITIKEIKRRFEPGLIVLESINDS